MYFLGVNNKMAISRKYSNSMIYLSVIFLGVILSTSSIFPMMSNVQAQPDKVVKLVERFDQEDIPPGMTRVTIIHGVGEHRTEIDHGPGKVPPPLQKQDSFECTIGSGTDLCDTNTWRGNQWPNLPVEYKVNLARSGDDGNFLASINAGIQVWENDPNSSFDANYLGTTGQKTSTAEPRGKMDGSNVIGWGSTKHFGGTVIAVVSYFYYTSTGDMVEADMRFNKDLDWSSNGGPGAILNPDSVIGDTSYFDVQAIAAHEGGHFVAGLQDIYHISEKELTMYGFGVEGELHPRTLGIGDQLSIASAYPSATQPTPRTLQQISVTPSGTSIQVETTLQYTATGIYSDSSTSDITNQVNWTSSNETAATINSAGLAYGDSEGTTTIRANSGSIVGSTSLTVTVAPPPGTVSVSSFEWSGEGGKDGKKHLLSTVNFDGGAAAAGTTVNVHLTNTNNGSWTGSGTAGSDGSITFSLKNAPKSMYTIEVTAINGIPTSVISAPPYSNS